MARFSKTRRTQYAWWTYILALHAFAVYILLSDIITGEFDIDAALSLIVIGVVHMYTERIVDHMPFPDYEEKDSEPPEEPVKYRFKDSKLRSAFESIPIHSPQAPNLAELVLLRASECRGDWSTVGIFFSVLRDSLEPEPSQKPEQTGDNK